MNLTAIAVWKVARARFADRDFVGKRLAFHALRATHATVSHEPGARREDIQATLGHASGRGTGGEHIRRLPSDAGGRDPRGNESYSAFD